MTSHLLSRRSVIKRILLGITGFAFVLCQSPVFVSALTDAQRQVFESGVYYFDVDTNDPCSADLSGSGPILGPLFPQISDTSQLANNIQHYIQNTLPSSPLLALSSTFVSLGQTYNVNPALIVAMTQKETSLGTAGYGKSPKYNVGNIRGGSDGTGFNSYGSYQEGIEAMYKNLRSGLYLDPPANETTVAQVINTWAPPSENDTSAYIPFVLGIMSKIYAGIAAGGAVASSCTGTVGSVDTSGYAFPVAPQRQSQDNGVSYASHFPCATSQPFSCHHDNTPAVDIAPQPGGDTIAGTPVYAISDGKVDMVHVYMGIAGCYSLQLHSSKDNYWYYYTHTQNVKVSTGDTVTAGQQIAEIGPSKCTGNGSGAHLHIDRGCVVDGVPQKGGLDSCRDPGFMVLINQLFSNLPN